MISYFCCFTQTWHRALIRVRRPFRSSITKCASTRIHGVRREGRVWARVGAWVEGVCFWDLGARIDEKPCKQYIMECICTQVVLVSLSTFSAALLRKFSLTQRLEKYIMETSFCPMHRNVNEVRGLKIIRLSTAILRCSMNCCTDGDGSAGGHVGATGIEPVGCGRQAGDDLKFPSQRQEMGARHDE